MRLSARGGGHALLEAVIGVEARAGIEPAYAELQSTT